ncbi:hypothetical protein EDEG_03739 [Edhazardia aedis USNM 41457]|uniref:Uncharacterized protein n=1 Tax=Edhazardia aedis (strain USNM 41457) TaxID=1003232 RepID=J9D2D0_EDHAE|nr:hypothetical protein EDEG_03739 [Edhazardia aedis USNM 41457]|eukprot:EJW01734.1 hypothetical protein EDEG_03739 [Edhazardia aedis USNM 41457]
MNIFLKDFCFGVLMIICTILLILLYNIDTYKSDELSEEQFGDLIFYEILGFVWVYNRFNYENTIPSENENADNAVKNFEKAGSNNNCFQNFNQKNAQSLAYSAYSETFNNKVEISILEISNILLSQIEPSKLDNYCIHDIFCSFKKFDSRHLNMGDYIEISNSFMNMIKANPKIYSINIKNQKIFIAPIDHQKLKSKISFFLRPLK